MKKTKILLAMLLALTLALSAGLMTAFADEPDPNIPFGTLSDPAQAAITKILQMPEGTNLPTANFLFNVASQSAPTGVASQDIPMPGTAGVVTISFDPSSLTNVTVNTAGGVTRYIKESASLFAGKSWPVPGEYVYTITEDDSASYTAGTNETVIYSGASYQLTVYVKQDSDSGTNYIFAIGMISITEDDGEPGDPALKKDPTPGSISLTNDYSQMIFTNSFMKVNGDSETDVKNLSIEKLTDGDFRDVTEYFNFTLTITLPPMAVAAGLGAASYEAVVLDDQDDNVTVELNGAADDADGFITVVPGTPLNFSLKHGERLVIPELPIGTTYAISEISPTNYIPTLTVLSGGTAVSGLPAGALSSTLTASGLIVADTAPTTNGANSALFTNLRNDINITGLNINDLPFIGMIALALAAGLFLLAAKARKAKKGYSC